jgi:DEAD/DEAH box helicase domain-containing protein
VRCAAFELPFGQPVPSPRPEGTRSLSGGTGAGEEGDAGGGEVNGEPSGAGLDELPLVRELLGVLAAQGMVRSVGESWYWMADAYPAAGVSLRSVGTTAVTIVQRGSGDGAGAAGDPDTDEVEAFDVLGTIERSAAALMVHPGAIYLHDGQAYAVQSLDWENGRATVAPADGAIYTRASASVDIRPTQVAASRPVAGATVSYGELEVRSRVTSFRQVRFRTHETVGWGEVDLPEQVHLAGGYWFTLDEETVERLRAIGHWRFDPLADRGPSWGQQRDRARARDGFRCRMCGAPERPDRGHDVHHIRPFREFGWVKGQNNAYVAANTLENLITLCRGCHRAAERALGLHGGLSGLGYALAHAAPLYLMCDGRDLGVTAESHAPWSKRPTIAIFERAAAGVGFGEALYRLHEELLAACATLIADCPCADGCPSCVGPADERGPDAKGHALAVLEALRTPAGSDEEQRC